ncbi:hypothetical protein HMPREF1222_01233 [Treponema vincentii F0403]|jgi:surface antigen bspA|uniref:Bacterial surface protein 26-residue n=1 Tax=Treponema vincentii F0403 TaxID=1125702 RepID=S3LQS2_9SPIR|nr:leucine-rich repeat domain-containing protein [Treponema vincentii]EPF46657.1 hypothetical protein HMPREF1222_01233 [Treponema vincentii F0403]
MNSNKKKMNRLFSWGAMVMLAVLVVGCNPNVSASSSAEKFTVTFTVNGENGKLTAMIDGKAVTSPVQVETEKTVIFTAEPSQSTVPNQSYIVDTWSVTPSSALMEGGQVENTIAKIKVTANTTVTVTFKLITYKLIAYNALDSYLKNTASESEINYIKVTGLTADKLLGSASEASPLGKTLQKYPTKRVALTFGDTAIAGLTDMANCFYNCTSLVHVSGIPDGVRKMDSCFEDCANLMQAPNIPDGVTDMDSCFYDCTKLQQVPNIPDSVTDMTRCFGFCTSLMQVPNIPDGVTDMTSCFFKCRALTSVTLKCKYSEGKFNNAFWDCKSLTVGSIKVPAVLLNDYRNNVAKMDAKLEWFAAE